VDVIVTSVLQTTAGKMIFGRLGDEGSENNGHTGGLDARFVSVPPNRRPPTRDLRPRYNDQNDIHKTVSDD
jgi:hypothetical protein